MASKGFELRSIILNGGAFAFGVGTADHAITAEKAGHGVLYAGGYAAAAVQGLPDMGILTREQMFRHIDSIVRRVNVPVMADADDGYGGILQTIRTVEDLFRKTEVAGIHLEDQLSPKRCGHIAGRDVIPAEEFVGKLRAALDVRNKIDSTRVLMARTDAFGAASGTKDPELGGDMKEAIRRGRLYVQAGADLVWCEFPNPSKKSAYGFAQGMKGQMPRLGLGFNLSPSFNWADSPDPVTERELRAWGYRFIFSTYPSVVAANLAVDETAKEFLHKGPFAALADLQKKAKGTPAESIMKLVGADTAQDLERRYSADARKRIETSDGFKGN